MDNIASSASSNFFASSSMSFRGVGLQNTVHSEIAPNLPLPSLPVFCGAENRDLRLFEEFRNLNRDAVVSQASVIAEMLHATDVSYLNLRADPGSQPCSFVEPLELYNKVLQCNLEAFNYSTPGPIKEDISNTTLPDKKGIETDFPTTFHASMDRVVTHSHQFNHLLNNDFSESASRKPKIKKKRNGDYFSSSMVDPAEIQDTTIGNFCAMLEDFCGRAEIPSDDRDEAEWLSMPVENLRMLVNEIISIRTKKILHLVPVDILVRLLSVLDNQIHRAEGLSIDECELSDSDLSLVYGALESIHASILVMANADMPKQLYKEEIIERILEFSRCQIMDIMLACDPSYRALHKPNTSGMPGGDEDEDYDVDYGSASKKRRSFRSGKMKKSAANKVSAATNTILQKLCTILGFIEELLFVECLSDGCILQLLKTCFTTFFVDNIHLLQLKALRLISGIFYSYKQHHPHVLDEAVQLLLKLAVSKRAVRAYHLPDEEQRQIQMVTALIIQLVQCSSNLPETLRKPSKGNSILEVSIDAGFLTKCHEAVTGVCVLFWSRVLQRFTNVKTQDASELKAMMENLVMDLLSTLNLPEFPGAAPLLEVLCVLLLQNAGLKSKDISVRSMAIDLLGLIAARLKHDAAICRNDKFWIVKELSPESDANQSFPEDTCSACFSGRAERLSFLCQGCHRLFHTNCIGIRDGGAPTNTWHCPFCVCKKQLLVLKSFCNSQSRDEIKQKNDLASEDSSITKVEVVQQMLLNHLQEDGSSYDIHLFSRWFYLCFWYKDDPKSVKEFEFYLSRLKSKDIVRDSMTLSSILSRDSVKKITLALGQNSSFSRGFDKILYMLLVSLRENSPVIRAKALRAVSIIVEADPEVLFEKRVQSAVEGRFCDSAISAREAALELVGRHIASHPGVGLKYFEKVAERIKDTGVSVRKRAIKIIRDMCTSNSNFTEFTSACIEIIFRVTDEESSIQDLVCKTFYEFWFEELPTSEAHLYGDGSSVPLDISKKTEQIVEMLRRMQSHKLLVTLIKRNLALDFFPQSAKAVGINPILIASVRKRCELMCKCLLERILQVEEMDSEEVEVRSLPYVLALHAFCIVDPTLCIPSSDPSQFVVTLQPYLKSQVDNRVVAQLLESIIFVIDSVLPLLRKVPRTVLEELEQDLKNMIVRHSFLTVVHACIKCLCSVSKVAGKGATVIEYLIQLFFKRLESLGIDNKQQIGRSLFCLGLLIRYGNPLLVTSTNRNVDTSSSLSLFKSYLHSDDFAIKVRSLQALGFVLIARPEYMLEKDVIKILEATLSPGSDIRLKIQALQNMYEYLVDAESQLDANKVSKIVNGHPIVGANGGLSGGEDVSLDGNVVPVAAGAGDTNICGGIVQLYWDYILGRTLDINEHVRQSALKIVEVVLRQGLVHPITCVPYLIALETDPQEANSKLAHHLLINMNEKYQSFFESRLGDGLQMSFIFIQSMTSSMPSNSNSRVQSRGPAKGKSDGGSFASARLGVSRIYRLIRGNRVSRNKFMSSIIRKFDTPSGDVSVIPFLVYCTEIMALLPFTVPDEPLYLIYAINRVVQVRAGVLESNMKALSSQLSQGQTQRKFIENGILQQEAEPALSYMPLIDLNGEIEQEEDGESVLNNLMAVDPNLLSMRSESTSCISEIDLQKIQADSLAATALQLLLKLKRHLKIVYSLNDARCQAFVPNEALKAGEVLSRQTIPFDVSEVRASLPTTYLEFVERYQEFKNALREDTVDYSIYTANIKRKRATPRKSGRSSRLMGDEEEDYDEDEEWTGGARTSGRKSSRGRLR